MTTPANLRLSPCGSAKRALAGATVGFFIGFGGVSLFGPTAHSFVQAMKLDPTRVGFLVAIPMLTGSLLRIPFGAWVDRNGGKLPFLTLLLASLVGIAGLWYMLLALYPDRLTPEHYPLLLLFGALGGCGIASFSVGIGQVSYWFPKAEQGRALAIYAGLGNTSPGLVAIVLPLIIAAGGLWFGYLISVGIVIAGIVLYAVLGFNAPFFQLRAGGLSVEEASAKAKELGQELFPAGSMTRTLLESAARWRTWALVALYFTSFGGFLALTAWLPTFWTDFYATPHWATIALTAGFSLLASVIRVPGGSLSDRVGGERVAAASYTVLLIGAALMSFSSRLGWTVGGEFLVAVGMGVANAAVFKLVPLYVPDAVGGAAGWVGGLGALGGFAVPPVLGAIAQSMGTVGYARGYIVYIGLALVSLLLTAVLYLGRNRSAR
ncbi:MAG: MFS transporter [Gammaproteobacteria bacterium]|nr:MFS transporter [Gammaproteobacteria bacterium]